MRGKLKMKVSSNRLSESFFGYGLSPSDLLES